MSSAANPKRPAAHAMAPLSGDGGGAAAKRRRTVVPAAALAAKIAALEAAVASGKAREAAQDRRIAALAADNARLSNENATLRKRLRVPEPPAALQLLVRALGAHERDLRDRVFELACVPRCLGTCARKLPPDPGFLGRLRSPFRWAPSRSSGTPFGTARAWRR